MYFSFSILSVLVNKDCHQNAVLQGVQDLQAVLLEPLRGHDMRSEVTLRAALFTPNTELCLFILLGPSTTRGEEEDVEKGASGCL
ncbi:hypothetical protein E2C01_004155 [Portunus trituberculatus]|uniref:Uncharacterized protein n=1 Tax=Portunus trituberculatus TaxID=210409 RepID=A0A5B7CQV1_PORTR|nr:hypothetical protein [Portunus trituberculatus]